MRHFDLSGDVIEALPPRAAEKLRNLRETAEELHAVYLGLSDKFEPLRHELLKAEHVLDGCNNPLTRPKPITVMGEDGKPVSKNPVLESAEARVAKARAEVERATERMEWAGARSQAATRTLTIAERYINEMIGQADLIEVPGETPDLRRGENYAQAVERVRKVIAGHIADLHAARSAPLHSQDVKAAIHNKLDTLVKKPSLFGAIERGLPIEWPTTRITGELIAVAKLPTGQGPVTGSAALNPINTLGLLAWLFRDRLAEALDAEIDEHADDRNALRADERAAKIAEALAARLEAERLEENLIEAAATVGQEIPRRADVDPRAVLGIDGPAPKERT